MRLTAVLVALATLLLSACSSPTQLLEKRGPLPITEHSLIRPPWETLVKAGPGAAKELDLETLNGLNTNPLLAGGQMPATAPETAITAVVVLPVTGASAQGARELTTALRKVIQRVGWPVLDKPREDALNIQGRVVVEEAQGASQKVRLDWAVLTPKGKDLGHVRQSNQVPAHSLDTSWGQAAEFATEAAGEGIFKLIAQYR